MRARETQNTHSTIGTVSWISQVLACISPKWETMEEFRSLYGPWSIYLLRVYCSAKSYYVPLVNLCLCKRMLDQLQIFEIFYQVNSYYSQIFAGRMILNHMVSCEYLYHIFVEASSLGFNRRKVLSSIVVDVSFVWTCKTEKMKFSQHDL